MDNHTVGGDGGIGFGGVDLGGNVNIFEETTRRTDNTTGLGLNTDPTIPSPENDGPIPEDIEGHVVPVCVDAKCNPPKSKGGVTDDPLEDMYDCSCHVNCIARGTCCANLIPARN